MTWQKMIVISAVAMTLGASGESRANFVTNGSFETTTNGNGELGYNTNATGWTTSGYNFLYASGTADVGGAIGRDGLVKLWGPGDGSANGLTASSPDHGNFVAADGAYEVGAIQQTINGLTVGNIYAVSFYWAGAQQSGFSGATTDKWQVSLGAQTQSTGVASLANHGFSGWMNQTFNFRASTSSEVLSFLAVGTPTGEPPFSLLDGVAITSVPEPSTMVLVGLGLLGCGVVSRLRRAKPAVV